MVLYTLCFVTGCAEEKLYDKPNEDVKAICSIVECLKN